MMAAAKSARQARLLDTSRGSRPNSEVGFISARSPARSRPADPTANREARDHDDHAAAAAAVRARAPVEETDPRFPSGPWTGFFLMATLAGPSPDGAAPELPPGRHDRRGPRPDRPVPDPRQVQPRRRQVPLDEAVHRQARRGLSGLQRGEGHLGPLGDPPVLEGRVPHLARRRWATRRIPTWPRPSTHRRRRPPMPEPAPEVEPGLGSASVSPSPNRSARRTSLQSLEENPGF